MFGKKVFYAAWIVIISLAIILGRFFYLQVIKSSDLQDMVASNRIKEIELSAERGKILDRNGNILAMSLLAQNISVYPNVLGSDKERQEIAKLLSDTLKLPYDEVYKKTTAKNKKGDYETWALVAKEVDPEIAQKIKEKKIYGIEIVPSPKRYYPNDNLASNILGFVNKEQEAYSGLELGMSDYLSGVNGYKISEVDGKGKVIPIGYENISSPQNGQNVTVSIDSYIQFILERRFQKAVKELNPKRIHGIVMDPKNGEIVAMASYPSFNPNEYLKADPNVFTNNPVVRSYEPGSTFKPIFMAMALEYGTINKDTRYDDNGSININGTNISSWNKVGWGNMSLSDIIVHSSNVGMIKIGETMTEKQIYDGLLKRGFGKTTGVELPAEATGIVKDEETMKNAVDKATVSFGQGITVNALQLVTAFSEIVNGGHNLSPHLVTEVRDNYGNVVHKPTLPTDRMYSQKNADLVRSYLHTNSLEGSGKAYQLNGYTAGTKTGTAQVSEDGKTYKDGAMIGSFMGFAPFDNPEYVTLIVVDQPSKGGEYGNEVSGPIWKDVMQEILEYKSIPKKGQKESQEVSVPNVKWLLADDAKQILSAKVKDVKITKSGKGEVVVDQQIKGSGKQIEVVLHTKPVKDKDMYYIPSFSTHSKEEIQEILKTYGLSVTLHGKGIAKEQTLVPGSYRDISKLSVWFQ